MRFYVLLALINLGCFLPLYLLNVRAAPNPFQFLVVANKSRRAWPLELLYARYGSVDPFRIHFDFTFFCLLTAALGLDGPVARGVATLLLAFGFIEIQYAAIMQSIFKRPAALASDWSLLMAGLRLAQKQAYWLVPAALGIVLLVFVGASVAVSALFAAVPSSGAMPLAIAFALLPPLLFHCLRFDYNAYLWRTVYSPLLHLALIVKENAALQRLYTRDAAHYERHNYYRDVKLDGGPNIVLVCIESYGSVIYRDARYGNGIPELLRRHEPELKRRGYGVASTLSDAPLFAGGSWLSYASFAYGTAIDNIQLYDALFSRPNAFRAYESLFHLLRRNGYENVLLCPLGGVDWHSVNWDSLDRCFQSQRHVTFDELHYSGPLVNYLGAIRRYSPLDQYSLNYGYETARASGRRFSLFFCSLNSHYPWQTVPEAQDDWRTLNAPAPALARMTSGTVIERYSAAIRYQLDYVLRFARDRAADDPLVVLFGDHQPPMITPERMGKQTPVHVLSRNPALVDAFLEHGFAGTLDMTNLAPRTIRHEGFLSLLARGLQAAYGTEHRLELPYREHGARLFEPAEPGVASR